MNLDDYRVEIDRIDKELIRLLEERFDVSENIMRYKEMKNRPILDSTREKQKLDALGSLCSDGKRKYITELLKDIMAQSREYQKDHPVEYGLLGRTLGHSLSAPIHKLLGGYDFGYFEREPEDLENFMKNGKWKGINVTIPYKRDVMKYCDELSARARACNSVNTVIRREDGSLYGDNTDYFGFRYTVETSGADLKGAKALVLGSGGVSGTVCRVLEDMGASSITIISRSGENNYENIDRHYDADVIVNTTPLGMFPNNGKQAIDLRTFTKCRAVYDLIYNPLKTSLVLQGRELGIPSFGGLKMLVAQAAEGCRLFKGLELTNEDIDRAYETMKRDRENITLIGMPGCGKSSVGRHLAEITGLDFIDTDELVTETEGRSPEDIIRNDGESAFRDIESRVLADAFDKAAGGKQGGRPVIISCGGGVVERADNYRVACENSRVIYVERALEDLPVDGRPVSQKEGKENLLHKREKTYIMWSDIRIDNTAVEETAEKLAEVLGYAEKA